MSDREFTRWLSVHCCHFPYVRSWLANLDDGEKTQEAWRRVVRPLDYLDACMASDTMLEDADTKKLQYQDHPAAVRQLALLYARRRIKPVLPNYEEQREPETEEQRATRRQEMAAAVGLSSWDELKRQVKQNALQREIYEASLRQPQRYKKTVALTWNQIDAIWSNAPADIWRSEPIVPEPEPPGTDVRPLDADELRQALAAAAGLDEGPAF